MPRPQISLKTFPVYKDDPYKPALESTEFKIVNETATLNTVITTNSRNASISSDGNHQILIKQNKVEEESWVKLYTNSIRYFYDLSKSDLILLEYITNTQKYNTNTTILNVPYIVEINAINTSTVYRSICILLDRNIIARSESSNTFYTNPKVFFKGNKFTLINTYTK